MVFRYFVIMGCWVSGNFDYSGRMGRGNFVNMGRMGYWKCCAALTLVMGRWDLCECRMNALWEFRLFNGNGCPEFSRSKKRLLKLSVVFLYITKKIVIRVAIYYINRKAA